MNEGIHLDLDTWIVPGQIPAGKPPPGSGSLGNLDLGHLDSPRPGPSRQTSTGVWETVTNQLVPRC